MPKVNIADVNILKYATVSNDKNDIEILKMLIIWKKHIKHKNKQSWKKVNMTNN